MISAILWVRKGISSERPERYELDEKEFERIQKLSLMDLEDVEEEAANVNETTNAETTEIDPALDEYHLEDYDKSGSGQSLSIFGNSDSLSYYTSNDEDPYITLDDEPNEDDADVQILPTDNLIIAARTEDDVSQLEIYVYGEQEDSLYVHHDILLPSFPLCLEWLDFRLGRNAEMEGGGNYVAVGTFEPEIEIWNLDVIDPMYPDAILGKSQAEMGSRKGKKKKRNKKPNPDYHVDAIMSLSWNKLHRNILASSSADTTVKLWDLSSLSVAHSFTHHKDKVQSVLWHPIESTVFVTASYDKTVTVLDSRAPDNITLWNLGADPECVHWDPFAPYCFYVSSEDGLVQYFDVRNGSGGAVFRLHAHDAAVSSMDVNPSINGCFVTGSTDKTVKIWNINEGKPGMVLSRNFDLGKVFTTKFSPDSPFQLAMAGSNGKVHVWDISSNAYVREAFRGRGLIPSTEFTLIEKEEQDCLRYIYYY
ncbi:10121_t:CDS:2 [Paraglomus brasilianum]|uniref:10121_t:CDS:1 n=1 Tax=Paraglomus brasilianum TaxID=144538 RepID=A0A9N8ZQS8_9GLOM|nr:10121_t:CDS:2 [Paraglomus brasilianum]